MAAGVTTIRPDGTIVVPLKRKYTEPKTKGRYKGGATAAKAVKKRNKVGSKSPHAYVPGSRVMVMSPTGKTRMVDGPAA